MALHLELSVCNTTRKKTMEATKLDMVPIVVNLNIKINLLYSNLPHFIGYIYKMDKYNCVSVCVYVCVCS